MIVLVTGAGGFIGRHVVEALLKEGHKVKAWDITFPHNYCSRAEIVCDDILSEKSRTSVLDGCDAIVHACNFNDASALKRHFDVNTIASWELLRSASQSRVKHFVFLSTYLLYSTERTKTDSFRENNAVFAKDFYTASKLAIESYCHAFQAYDNLACTILRLAAVYGIHRDWNTLRCLPYTRQMMLALENKDIEVYGQSPLIWVGDVAKSVMAILGEAEKASDVYNLVDINLEWRDCARKVVDIVGSSSKIISVCPPHKAIVINGEKFRRDFGLEFVGTLGFEHFLEMLKNDMYRLEV